jgi:chloramphenicol-sensitive protein RarD
MVFAVAAVGVLTFSYGQVPWLALSIAGSWTAYVYLKRGVPLSPVESMAAESFVLLAPAAVVLALVAGRSGSVLDAATGWQMVMVAGLGVITVAPLMGLAFAAQRVPLTLLGPMQYSVPTINFLLGWLVYDESLPPSRVVGFALVWIGLAVITVDTVQRTRTARLGSPAPADVGPDATAAVRQP